MVDIIRLLPDSIANQIAAGEVVQRPASVVKELMENSIDAKATDIRVIVKNAGSTLIQVIDNGTGMSYTDARMSLERHSTSKIQKPTDLFALTTMGFRGEALASIVAVSQMELKSRQEGAELGTSIVVEGSEVKKQEWVACEKGTNIKVKNLFFNTPARRNFLKSNSVELRHILNEFERIALSHPELSFSFVNGDEFLHDLSESKLSQRIVNMFGKSFQNQLVPCQEETPLVKVTGYVGKPSIAKKTRGDQFLYVNNRYIRSNHLNFAVTQAFEGLLKDNSYPFYVLFISINPKHIDVNIHPTKTEIKFDDERAIYAVITASVRQALGIHNITPSINYDADVNFIHNLSTKQTASLDQFTQERYRSNLQRSNLDNWEKIFADEKVTTVKPQSEIFATEKETSPNKNLYLSEDSLIFQWHEKYLVWSVKKGLMFIDQQAAHERILFEKFLKRIQDKSATSTQCLFPEKITFSIANFTLVTEMSSEIRSLGFQFDILENKTIEVKAIPMEAMNRNVKELFEGLIEQFKQNQSNLSLPTQDNLVRSLAKRVAIKSGQKLSKEEVESIVKSLFSCHNPNYSLDGNLTFHILEAETIENYFD